MNLPYSVVWGGLAVLNICVVNPFLRKVFGMIPRAAGEIILIVLLAVTLLDLAGTLTGILKVRSHVKKQSLLYEVSENLQRTADMMGQGPDEAGAPPYGEGLSRPECGRASEGQKGAGAEKGGGEGGDGRLCGGAAPSTSW